MGILKKLGSFKTHKKCFYPDNDLTFLLRLKLRFQSHRSVGITIDVRLPLSELLDYTLKTAPCSRIIVRGALRMAIMDPGLNKGTKLKEHSLLENCA